MKSLKNIKLLKLTIITIKNFKNFKFLLSNNKKKNILYSKLNWANLLLFGATKNIKTDYKK